MSDNDAQHAESVAGFYIGPTRIMGGMNSPIRTVAGPYPCKPCIRCGEQPETSDRVYGTDDGIVCAACWRPDDGA